MTATDAKSGEALFDYFYKKYKSKYGKAPELNRFKEKWNFASMIKDLGAQRSKEVIDYFFELPPPHTVMRLFRGYADMSRLMRERAEDAERREELRKKTEEKVRNWKRNV